MALPASEFSPGLQVVIGDKKFDPQTLLDAFGPGDPARTGLGYSQLNYLLATPLNL